MKFVSFLSLWIFFLSKFQLLCLCLVFQHVIFRSLFWSSHFLYWIVSSSSVSLSCKFLVIDFSTSFRHYSSLVHSEFWLKFIEFPQVCIRSFSLFCQSLDDYVNFLKLNFLLQIGHENGFPVECVSLCTCRFCRLFFVLWQLQSAINVNLSKQILELNHSRVYVFCLLNWWWWYNRKFPKNVKLIYQDKFYWHQVYLITAIEKVNNKLKSFVLNIF